MLDWLSLTAQANPDGVALIYNQQQWTYAELDEQVDAMGGWLTMSGVTIGQHVAVLMPNRPEYVFIIHALIRLGAVLIPLNVRLTPEELAQEMAIVDCDLIVCSIETDTLASSLPCTVVSIDAGDPVPRISIPARELDFEATHAVIFTSGTTGTPKGATLTYGNHFWSATASAFRLGTLPDDRWLLCLPLYHVGGLNIVLRCCIYGTTVVLQRGFDVEATGKALIEHAVTLVSLVPTMLYRLLESGELLNFSKLRLVLLGGAAASPELIERCQRLNLPVATTYGLTEADSQVATQTPEATRRKPGSVGKALPFTTIRVVDDEGRLCKPGDLGEIVISGSTVMSGYYHDSGATARTLHDGRLYTGDVGYIDNDGDLWVVQRRSDLIVTGGENVYPVEVEGVIKRHTGVSDVCVVPVQSAEWGQQVGAAVVLRPNATLTADDLIHFCRERLAGYKIPRIIRFIDTLPVTSSGKIERRAVIALLDELEQ